MIHRFSIKNFYSIGEEVAVGLRSNSENARDSELYLDSGINNEERFVSKICLVGGANASGKTNVLRALAYIKYLMVDSIMFGGGDDMNFCQFALYKSKEPTILSVDFSTDSTLYSYTVELSDCRIIHEMLSYRRLVNKRITRKKILSRYYSDGEYICKISDGLTTISKLTTLSDLLNDNPCAGVVAILNNFDQEDGALKKIYNYWRNVASNIQMYGSFETNHSMTNLSINSLKHILKDQRLLSAVASVLRKLDLGFENFSVVNEIDGSTGRLRRSYGMNHRYGDSTISLSMNHESSGTQRLIILLETILEALSHKDGVAIVDELDAYLHPDAFDEIINMVISSSINKNNAQLIFSTQNYSVMSRLLKDQIVLTDKNDAGQTEVWRLDDIAGVNSRDDFYRKYLTGAYGGVPEIG